MNKANTIIDLGIPVSVHKTKQFPSLTSISGLFIGISKGKVNSLILSDDIFPHLENAPEYDSYAYANIGITLENYKSFNKILTRFKPQYHFNYIDDFILNDQFSFTLRNSFDYIAQSNSVFINLKFDGMERSFLYKLDGFNIALSEKVILIDLPDFQEYSLYRGKVICDGVECDFLKWFEDNVDSDVLRKALKFSIKRKYQSVKSKTNIKGIGEQAKKAS